MRSAALALGFVAVTWAAPARSADDWDRAPHPDTVKSIRLSLPFYGYTISNAKTYIDVIAASASARFSGVWTLGAGLGFQSGQHGGSDFFASARFGVTPTLVDTGDFDGGWTVNAGPFFGYRFDSISDRVLDEFEVHESLHSVTHHLGLEITRWWPSHAGLDILLLGGLVLPFAHVDDENFSRFARYEQLRHAIDARVEVGVAF